MNVIDNNEDYLKKYLDNELNGIENEINKATDNRNIESDEREIHHPNLLEYISVDLSMLPLGKFYKNGTKIKIRAAKVSEVQAFSVVDNNSIIDVSDKINYILSNCVKVILPDGKFGSYKDIKYGDNLFLIFMIRELTFQRGNSLVKEVACEKCGHEFNIPYRATSNSEHPSTFEFYEESEKLLKYFNNELKCFEFEINDKIYRVGPPNLGIQEFVFKEIENRKRNEKNINLAFFKFLPFLMYDRVTISKDGLKAKEEEFKKMDMLTFQKLNAAIDNMKYGIKGLKMNCPVCNEEVHTEFSFPGGASNLFIISDPFE